MNPTDPDERATFDITVDETGRGRVDVNGHDVSDHVTGLSFNVSPGSIPVLRLDMDGDTAIEGAGIVEVVREPLIPTRRDLALSILRKIFQGDDDPMSSVCVNTKRPSILIDGWSAELDPAEHALVKRLEAEARAAEEAAWEAEHGDTTEEHQ